MAPHVEIDHQHDPRQLVPETHASESFGEDGLCPAVGEPLLA